MSLELKGKIIAVLESRTGTSDKGEWTVQSWVLEESDGQYPKKIAFEAFNKGWDLKVGQEYTIGVNLESREYQGKWFTSCKAWKFDPVNGGTAPNPVNDAMNAPAPPAINEPPF